MVLENATRYNIYDMEARHPLEARRPGNHLIQPHIPPRYGLSNAVLLKQPHPSITCNDKSQVSKIRYEENT
jgi:hypothetical protein